MSYSYQALFIMRFKIVFGLSLSDAIAHTPCVKRCQKKCHVPFSQRWGETMVVINPPGQPCQASEFTARE